MKLTEKLISENHRDEFPAKSGKPSISPSPLSLSTIIRNRDKLRNYDSLNSCSKRRRTCVHEDFDEAVMKWIHTMQDKNVLISEPFVIEKAFPFVKGLHRNVDASRFNEPDGRQGCVLTRTVESNQGGRFDSNESVVDSFLSGEVGFKSWSATILGAFFPLTSVRKNLQSGSELAARGHPSVAPLLSDKYHPCKF
ncbi:tigger transposable element-derived protein 4 [Trichonephila clavipes]|nr:tigger transposable element-derived protein 4 [Trichonephila clavipes]